MHRGREPATLIESLPERFIPQRARGLTARFRVTAGAVARDVLVVDSVCRVVPPEGHADVSITTDAATWSAIDRGRTSGLEAFAENRLFVRGSIEQALRFETLFRRPRRGALVYSIDRVDVRRAYLSVLETGPSDAPVCLLLHGLGATKASWLPVVPHLARSHRVLAVDFPGFGASSKPAGTYDAAWFARSIVALLDELGVDRASVAGNSMGGRVAVELALRHPRRVTSISCLCPAAAWSRRPLLRLARLARPELGMFAPRLPRGSLVQLLKGLFADPARVHPEWFEAAVDDFLNVWKSPLARLAFFSAARRIYLEEPDGDAGYWTRLPSLGVPALFVYGGHDQLISPGFAGKVRRAVPAAEIAVWDDCGHVPQIEHPARTARTLESFLVEVPMSRAV